MSNIYGRVLRNNFINHDPDSQLDFEIDNKEDANNEYDMMKLDPEVEKELREAFSQFDKGML